MLRFLLSMDPLLGKDTATSLGVLKTDRHRCSKRRPKDHWWDPATEVPPCFQWHWKAVRSSSQLHIDPNVKPVAQPMRRTPFSMRSKLEEKIKELIELDINEPAQGPTPWVNPGFVVPESGETSVFAFTCEGITRQYGELDTRSLLLMRLLRA